MTRLVPQTFAKAWVLSLVAATALSGVAAGPTPSAGGTQLWEALYNGPGNNNDQAYSVAASPDGQRVFVTGVATGATGQAEYHTIAYDAATGSVLWEASYGGTAGGAAFAVGVSPDGARVFVTGWAFVTGLADYVTLAYDATTGAQLWLAIYNGPRHRGDKASSLVVSPDGSRVFVTGTSRGHGTGDDYATVAYDATTGSQLWVSRYTAPGVGKEDSATAIAASPDGSKVVVTGNSYGLGSGPDYATVAYDAATGGQLWVMRYNGTEGSYDLATAVAVAPDSSSVFVSGRSRGVNSGYDYATIAYDASTGAVMWGRRYRGPGRGDDWALAIAVSPDGSRVIVTGYSQAYVTTTDFATIAYDSSTGSRLWVARYTGEETSSIDEAFALAVTPDGSKVIVTGVSGRTGNDAATVAYDSGSGSQLWVARYNHDLYTDVLWSVAVSPDSGTAFVTGYTGEPTTGTYDYVTLAYQT